MCEYRWPDKVPEVTSYNISQQYSKSEKNKRPISVGPLTYSSLKTHIIGTKRIDIKLWQAFNRNARMFSEVILE